MGRGREPWERSEAGGVNDNERHLHHSSQTDSPLVVSAYADDINIFVKNENDIHTITKALKCYEKASSSKVNWDKSEALKVGQWREEKIPCLPGGLKWGSNGIKCLGVFLGTQQFQEKNWEGVMEKVCAKISKWRWLLPQMSYRGRVLVINNLVASMLWHKVMVLNPPKALITSVQKIILDFFWSGYHWIRAAALYLPLCEGGQGLVDVSSRIGAFRLKTAQRFLYGNGLRWHETAKLLLQKVGRLGYSKQFFLLKLEEVQVTGLTSFYDSVLQAWQILKVSRDPSALPGMWIFEEPLFYNDFLYVNSLKSASLRSALRVRVVQS